MKISIIFLFALFVVGWSAGDFMVGDIDWKALSAAAIGWLACAAQLKLNGNFK